MIYSNFETSPSVKSALIKQTLSLQLLYISDVWSRLKSGHLAPLALCYYYIYCIFTPSRHMVLTRFPTLTGLVSTPPVLHPCFSLASSASCDAFTEQQTSFMEPGPCSTQARSSLGKNKRRDVSGEKAFGSQYISLHREEENPLI